MSGLEQRKERWAGWPYRSAQNGFATGRNSAPEVGRVAIVPDRQKYCLRLLRRPDTQTEPGMQLRGILAPRGKRRSVLRRALKGPEGSLGRSRPRGPFGFLGAGVVGGHSEGGAGGSPGAGQLCHRPRLAQRPWPSAPPAEWPTSTLPHPQWLGPALGNLQS